MGIGPGARPKGSQDSHQPEGFHPHVAESFVTAFALEQTCHPLDLVADLGVGGEVRRFDPATTDGSCGLELGAVVLFLVAPVHQPGRFDDDLPPKLLATTPTIISGPVVSGASVSWF